MVGSGDIGPTARNFTKNPSQRLDTGIIPTPWWFTPECEQQLLSIGEDGKIPSSIKPDSATPDSTIAELTEEQLRHRLKLQLEYYFSRENLNQDRYLRSQMDNDQYVPISIVASFPKISHLTSDQDLIISVLKESINVQVDESNTKVRAAHRRCTLLLREIPEFTDDREVKAMFIGCPPYTSLKYGLNNSWYVTFETEEATQLAFLHLQNLRKSFNGKQICVRIKTGTAPLPDPSATNGRNSPAKSDIFVGIGNGISTIATSKGYITGFPAASTFTINPNCTTRLTTETELNLDQLMGTFGYTIRAIFQPKESEPPKNEQPSENVPLLLPPDEKKAKRESPTGTLKTCNILGPPSTEIVGSMLSAAAEANETKKREREVQKQQWQQIMDNLAPMPSIMGGQRITDSLPFIKKPPPILSRFISQESADIEVALDIQRAAKKKQETEAKAQQQAQQQQQQQIQQQQKIQQQQQQQQQQQKIQQQQQVQQQQQQQQQRPQIQQVHVQQHHQTYSQPQHQHPHYQQPQQSHHPQQQHQHYNNNDGGGYRQNNSNRNYSDRSKDYNGYSSGERSNYDKSDRRSNQPYRGGRSYDSRSDRSGKSDSYSNKSDYSNKNENYHKNESYNKTEGYNNKNDNYTNKNESYYKSRGERNNYNSNTTSTASNNYYYDRSSTSNYSNQQQRYEKPRYQSDRKPAASRNYQQQQQQNYPSIQTTSYPSTPSITAATTVTTSESKLIATTSTTKTPPITPSSSSTVPQPATTNQPQKIVPVVIIPPPSTSSTPTTTTTTIVHSDAASTISSSTRKKDNSESSEYNFVDGDFPSLVEKQKVKEKEKEKAKFSAVVAGKKNDVKKSYAQTLKRQESKQSSKADAT
uniref:HTH La-type RNA-binding domain-containing protein n=2 Tax=Panagrolaimus sp. PS1159 TaxID=55785 RepID=A0AC35GWH1_9BILA